MCSLVSGVAFRINIPRFCKFNDILKKFET